MQNKNIRLFEKEKNLNGQISERDLKLEELQ